MPLRKLRRLSLRSSLSLLLLAGLMAVAAVNFHLTRRDALAAADAAYDRSLLGALKAVEANISTASGGLSVELPYRMFEFFELTASGNVYFRVATSDGLVELGSADLPAPPQALQAEVPVFYDALYFDQAIRVAAYKRSLDRPIAQSMAREILIQVAESTQSRRVFSDRFVARAMLGDALMLAAMLVAGAAAVTIALRPLSALADQVRGRKPEDLTPLPEGDLPSDILPLVTAVNQQLTRTQVLIAQRREFLDDASHQLRTHLTTLHLQAGYALRESDPNAVHSALRALNEELGRASRSTHQLLTLARSDTADIQWGRFDLAQLVRQAVVEMMPRARARGTDLGVQPLQPIEAAGDEGLLREALLNLVANAIDYAPPGASVTVSAAQDEAGWSLDVEDSGPGLTDAERDKLGKRFVRGTNHSQSGSGLGLAIARSIAGRHSGALQLQPRQGGPGLHAIIRWPRPAGPNREATA